MGTIGASRVVVGSASGTGGGVAKITAGTNMVVTPTSGVGTVTVATVQSPVFTHIICARIAVTTDGIIGGGSDTLLLRPGGTTVTTGELTITTTQVKLHAGSSFVTTTAVVISTPTITSGTAFTPNSTKDSELSLQHASTGSTTPKFTMTFGPTTGAEHTIVGTTANLGEAMITKRIPAGWKVIINFPPTRVAQLLIQTV